MTKFCFAVFTAIIAFTFTACNNGKETNTTAQDTANNAYSVKLAYVTGDVPFPVEMKASPDSTKRLFIAALGGKIFIYKDGHVLPTPFLDISHRLENKDSAPPIRGMYSMVFDPQFATNGKLYVSYNAPTKIDSNKCKLVISQFTVSRNNPDIADTNSERRVFELEGHNVFQDADEMTFGPDGYLYIGIGDNGTPMRLREGQKLSSYLGKLLRIDVHTLPYKVPADNPFIHTKNAKPEIWAYGLRRFWRFVFDSTTHTLIGGDVGDKAEEEIDTITKGGNYGWPLLEGDSIKVNKDSLPAGVKFIAPVITYRRNDGICVIGGSYYHGTAIPFLQGKYVFADYNGNLFFLTQNAQGAWVKQQMNVKDKPKNPFIINSYSVGLDNEIYLIGVLNTDEGTKGAIYKMVGG